jgi:hypothetical protein
MKACSTFMDLSRSLMLHRHTALRIADLYVGEGGFTRLQLLKGVSCSA